jgi:hypothetical protein
MESKLKTHPMGFMYEDTNDGSGKIYVSYNETKKYLDSKSLVYLVGLDDNEEDWLIRFSDTLKSGKYFYKVDMFGKRYILEKKELINLIEKYYNPKVEKRNEKYISICSEHLIENKK